ncbi:MAG: hypothetical protein VCF07_10515, partial [Nitrospinota bacterium]
LRFVRIFRQDWLGFQVSFWTAGHGKILLSCDFARKLALSMDRVSGRTSKTPGHGDDFFLGVVQLTGAGHADRPLNEGEVKK